MLHNYKISYYLDIDPDTKREGITSQTALRGIANVDVKFTTSGEQVGPIFSYRRNHGGSSFRNYIIQTIAGLKKEARFWFKPEDKYACMRITFNLERDCLYKPTFLVWLKFEKLS